MKQIRLTKKAQAAALSRATGVIARVEQACADKARLTGDVVPGMNERDLTAVFLDELTRHPVPNRADRRRARR